MRWAAKVDRNHNEITQTLRKLGWRCIYLKTPCDLLICRGGQVRLVEIKRDAKAPLTKVQKDLLADGFPLHVVRTVAEASEIR